MKEKIYIIDGEPENVLYLDEIKVMMKSNGYNEIIIQELVPDKEENDDFCLKNGTYINEYNVPICQKCNVYKKLKGNIEECDDLIHISFKLGSKIVLLEDGSMIKFSDIKN